LYESGYLTALVESNQPACKYRNNKNSLKKSISEGLDRCNSPGIHNNVNLFSALPPELLASCSIPPLTHCLWSYRQYSQCNNRENQASQRFRQSK